MVIQSILVVDDEAEILQLAELSLRRLGRWSVSVARGGAEGLAVATTVRPDVILLDVMMPAIGGLDVLRQLAKNPRTSDIPVLLMTANSHGDVAESYRALGACGLIAKPFSPMELPKRIRELVEGRPAQHV